MTDRAAIAAMLEQLASQAGLAADQRHAAGEIEQARQTDVGGGGSG